MTIFLLIIIVILLVIIFIQLSSKRKLVNDLFYIQNKLSDIIENKTNESLLVVTDETVLQSLLIRMNELLEYTRKTRAGYHKNEISMKKMLSNFSHDIKTPLTVVLGYIETLKLDGDISYEERDEMLSDVQNKTNEIINLINKFFDLAKLESGDKDISLSRIYMNEICEKSILSFYDILTKNDFEVEIKIPDHNIYALANEEALQRILNNLISNAIKYGSYGKFLGLELREDTKHVYIDIWDKGVGIDELHQDKVFERMYTLEDSRNKKYQGSGLGLTITKRLVEKLDGQIMLTSKPYEKTMFTIKLKRIVY